MDPDQMASSVFSKKDKSLKSEFSMKMVKVSGKLYKNI